MFFGDGMHPYSKKCSLRDAFRAADASLFDEKSAEGCFSSGGSIFVRRNFRWGMLFKRRMHLYLMKNSSRDAFRVADASLFDEKSAEGCFSKGKCIPQGHESTLEMH